MIDLATHLDALADIQESLLALARELPSDDEAARELCEPAEHFWHEASRAIDQAAASVDYAVRRLARAAAYQKEATCASSI